MKPRGLPGRALVRRRHAGGIALAAAALLVVAPALPARAGPPVGGYVRTVFTLGTPDSPYYFRPSTTGNPVNASGVVVGVGQAYGFREPYTAVVYDTRTGARTSLGTLRGSDNSAAADVNDGGDVVGAAGTDIDGGPTLAFLWTRARPTLHTLGSLDPQDPNSAATAVSNAGVVVGWTYTPDSGYAGHAFVWDPTVTPVRMRDLGTLGGVDSVAYGISSTGTIVGSATTRRRVVRPVLWSAGQHTITDLGTLPGYDSGVARDVSPSGYVVGEDYNAATPEQTRAFIWSPVTRKVTALSTPVGQSSRANAINYHDVIAGQLVQPSADGTSSSVTRAAVWGACSPLTVLPGDGTALGLTRQERIVGSSSDGLTGWVKAGPCT